MKEPYDGDKTGKREPNYAIKLPIVYSVPSEYAESCVELSVPHPKSKLGPFLSDCTLPGMSQRPRGVGLDM